MDRARIEREMAEIVDWSAIKYHTDMIETFIGKMERHKLDYTGDMRYEIERMVEIFEEAEEKARNKLLQEDEDELSSLDYGVR
jgi:hypothetical protein